LAHLLATILRRISARISSIEAIVFIVAAACRAPQRGMQGWNNNSVLYKSREYTAALLPMDL
jgi:hypothetical protein